MRQLSLTSIKERLPCLLPILLCLGATAYAQVNSPPTITSQPQGLTNALASSASFTVTATGDPPLSYQWRANGSAIAGATGPIYTIATLQAGDSGNYDVVVTNPYGAVTSQVAVLYVTVPGLSRRTLQSSFAPGEIITARLDVAPPPDTTNWSIAEFFPGNWSVVSAPDASATNDLTGELDFGPFTDAQPRTFIYQVASIFELTNAATFGGQVQFNGTNFAVAGYNNIPAVKEWEFVGPQSLTDHIVSGAAYGAGRWVATTLGWGSTLADGAAGWSYPKPITGTDDEGWSRMAFLGGKFLFWGNGGIRTSKGLVDGIPRMAASDDGLSWKPARGMTNRPDAFDPFAGFGNVQSATFGNGVYVAVGVQQTNTVIDDRQGVIWYSTNAYNWTRTFTLNYSTSRELHSVAFSNGLFVAVGDLATIVTSTNGIDWAETQATNTTQNLTGVGCGPSGWLVVQYGASGQGLRSLDGTNWSSFTGVGFPPFASFYYCYFADGKYWFTSEAGCYTTVDGASWSPVRTLDGIALTSVRRAPDGVSPRYLGGYLNGTIYGSSDSTNWTVLASDATSGGQDWPNHQTVVASGSNCLVSGLGCGRPRLAGPVDNFAVTNVWPPLIGAPGAPSVWFTEPGFHWTNLGWHVAISDYLPSTDGLLVAGVNAFGFPLLLTAGPVQLSNPSLQGYALTNYSRAVNYQDYGGAGANWGYCNACLSPGDVGYDLYAEAGSFNQSGGASVNWGHYYSTNGTDWQLHNVGLNNAANFPGIRGLAYGAGRYVAVATGSTPGVGTSTNRIYSSTDGETYQPVDLSTLSPKLGINEGLTSVAFAAGTFITVGSQGTILYSTNGTSWQNVRPSDGFGWNRVRFLNNTWWVVGQNGRIASSTDGRIWTTKATGVQNNLNDIASLQGYYVVVGNNAMVLLSTFHTSQPPVILPNSLIRFPDGSFQFTVQTDPNVLPLIETSPDLATWSLISPAHTPANSTGLVTFTDAASTNQPRRFYRARLP